MGVREMAEAHLQNVQQQINDLREQSRRIEADIQTLVDYHQNGVQELNSNSGDIGEVVPPQIDPVN
jgi:uncharacterized coiled-coil DUF342 family protein